MLVEKKIYIIIYAIMIAFVIAIVAISSKSFDEASPVEMAADNLVLLEEGWTNDTGENVNITKLHKLEYVEPGKEFSVFYTLPNNLGEGMTFSFRTKNIIFNVYIDNKCIYSSYVSGGELNSKATGTSWHYIDLDSEYAGKTMEFRITTLYKSAKACIDNVFLGLGRNSLLYTIHDKLFAVVTCIIFLFVGILLVIADFPANAGTDKNHELLYLGLFSLVIALWCLLETYSIQIFTGDSKTIHIAGCCMLMLIPIPTVLYLYEAYGRGLRYVVRTVVSLSTIVFTIAVSLQLTGKADFQETLKMSQAMLVVSALILFPTVIYHTIVANKKKPRLIINVLRGLGLGSIAVATIVDMIRFYKGASNDNAKFVRVGLLCFIISYGSASLERIIDAIKLGAKAELVSQLAYHDGLTSLGNRTAFNEVLEELDVRKQSERLEIGIIMFDVNNLKVVNDSLGHQAGDDMLTISANVINKVFGSDGKCFRIGGDEFVVILQCDNAEQHCIDGMERLTLALDNYNENREKNFFISIAGGYSIYKPDMGDIKLEAIFKQADTEMYNNKKKMKENFKMA